AKTIPAPGFPHGVLFAMGRKTTPARGNSPRAPKFQFHPHDSGFSGSMFSRHYASRMPAAADEIHKAAGGLRLLWPSLWRSRTKPIIPNHHADKLLLPLYFRI